MTLRFVRLALLLGVILGVVLPKTSAALAGLGMVDGQRVVICTAHGLQEIDLDPQDDPAPSPAGEENPPCLLIHALDGVAPVQPPAWVAMARAVRPEPARIIWRGAPAFQIRFARAPPRA